MKKIIVVSKTHLDLGFTGGIEPLSENQSTQASPGAVGLLNFPRCIAVRQAMQFGSPQYNHVLRGAWTDRSPLIDAPSAAVVLRSGTAA